MFKGRIEERFGKPPGVVGALTHEVMRGLVRFVGFPYFGIRRRNLSAVPTEGGLIIAPGGHRSNLDTLLVGASAPRRLFYMAKSSLFKNWFWSWFIVALGGFPVQRERVDRQALKYARMVLDRGDALVIFPEGERKAGPIIHPLFSGPVWLSEVTRAPILPGGIGGTERAMPKGVLFPRPRRVRVVFGEVIPAPKKAPTRASSTRCRQDSSDRLREAIQELFDEAQAWAGGNASGHSRYSRS